MNIKETSRETTLCLASAHALVRLDDGTVVGDPMEKATLEALEWTLTKGMLLSLLDCGNVDIMTGSGDIISPTNNTAPHAAQLTIRRRYQFSSALKRMSTVSSLKSGKVIASVKGAPETIKGMLASVPDGYDESYKWFTRRGSRVLAMGIKDMDVLSNDKVRGNVALGYTSHRFYKTIDQSLDS